MAKRRAAFVYDESLTTHILRPDHPLNPARLRYVYDLLKAYQAFDGNTSRIVTPRPASEEEVLTFHTPEYVQAVRALSAGDASYRPEQYGLSQFGDTPAFPGMYEASLLSTGASLVAAELVLSGKVDTAFNGAGGLHHAMADHASGFCIFNDPVIAINLLRRNRRRVAYIDVDAHHGDGVQAAFYNTNEVLTISLHESGRYLFPGTGFAEELGAGKGIGFSVNVPLAPYTDDEVYLWAFHEVVPPLIKAFEPDVIVTQLGIDGYHSDPLTHLALTTRAFEEVVKWFASLGLPWMAMGGGGYDVGAVTRCWALAYGVMMGEELGDDIPQPFARHHGLVYLRDREGPRILPEVKEQVWEFARQSVARVKQLIFPYHGLK